MYRHLLPRGSRSDADEVTHPLQTGTGETLDDLARLVERYQSRGMIRPKASVREPAASPAAAESGALDLSLRELLGDDHEDHAESHASESSPPLAVAGHEEHAHDDRTRAVRRPGLRTVAIVTALALIGVAGAFANKIWPGGDRREAIGDIASRTTPAALGDNDHSAAVANPSSRPEDAAPAGPLVPEREAQTDRAPRQIIPANDPYRLASAPAAGSVPSQPIAGPASADDRRVPADRIATAEDSSLRAGNDPAQTSSAPPASGPAGKLSALAPQAAQPSAAAPANAQPPAGGTYLVQLSSQRSEAAAQATSRLLQTKHPTIFADLKPFVRRSDLAERGVYYRSLVGPFTGLDSAKQFCGNLKKAGGDCVVQKN